jgi:hypothetical protein
MLTAVPRDPDRVARNLLKFARTIRTELTYKDLPLTLLSLAIAIFAAAVSLSAYEGGWFHGTEFVGSCVVSVAFLIAGSAIYIAELAVLGSGFSEEAIEVDPGNWTPS